MLVERPESDVLLLSLTLDAAIVAETLPAYEAAGAILVPLGELCRLLGLGITVHGPEGVASGYFIDERRLFALDVPSGTVIVEGQPRRFDRAAIEVHRDDIYLDAALLSEWLALGLEVDLYGATIAVHPREQLPMQRRLERERKLELSGGGEPPGSPPLTRVELPYRFGDGPFLDQTVRYSVKPRSSGGSLQVVEYSTYLTGDLLRMEASAFVSGNDSEIADSRFTLARKDPDGGLLGFLGAREVSLGSVFHPGLDLLASPTSGPGLLLSNHPLHLQSQYDRQSFRGDLPPGWEVELYRGEELLAYAQSRADGLFEFLDVPLLFGLNLFRIEFYGAQGQRRTEHQRFNVGEALTPKGRVYYRLAADRPDYGLLGPSASRAQGRATFDLSAGLSKHLSVAGSVAAVDLEDGRHTYGMATLRGYWSTLFANLNLATDRAGGSAWQGALQTRLGVFGALVQHAQLHDFVSEPFLTAATPLTSRSLLRLDAAIPGTLFHWLPRLPMVVELRQDRYVSGGRVRALSGRISSFRRGFAVANQVQWSSSSGFRVQPLTTASGQLLISKFHRGAALRGEVDYGLEPDTTWTSLSLTAEKRLAQGVMLSLGGSRLFATGQTRVEVGLNKLEGAFGLGVTADYASRDGFGGSLQLSVSLGRDARDGGWHSQARPLAGFGALSGRAFLDANGNGTMDAGEAGIADAGFLVNGSGQLQRTDASGRAFLTNLTPHEALDLAVSPSTLEDPYWRPAAGVQIVPRPGKVAVLDFPVTVSGEVTGTVFLQRDGIRRAASGVELELVDERGNVVLRVRTAFDGFYDLTEIRAGRYTLRVTAEQLQLLNVQAASRAVELLPQGTVVDGLDFVLQGAATAAAPLPQAGELTVPPPSPEVRASGAPTMAGNWALQVHAMRDPVGAAREAGRLSVALGRPARVVAVDLGALGKWHRVYLCGFQDAAAAAVARRALAAQGIEALAPVRLVFE